MASARHCHINNDYRRAFLIEERKAATRLKQYDFKKSPDEKSPGYSKKADQYPETSPKTNQRLRNYDIWR